MLIFQRLAVAIRARLRARCLIGALLLGSIIAFSLAAIPSAYAQKDTVKLDVDATLDKNRAQIDAIRKSLDGNAKTPLSDAQLAELRARALDAQSQTEAVASALKPQLAGVQARLAELGTPEPDVAESPDVRSQRSQLSKSSASIDAQLKLASLIALESSQAADQTLKMRRALFQAQLGERRASILGASFWSDLRSEWPKDVDKLAPVGRALVDAVVAASPLVWPVAGICVALVLGFRVLAGRLLLRWTSTRVAPGRLRRSLYAAALVFLAALTPGLIAALVRTGLGWDGYLSNDLMSLLSRLTGVIALGGFASGLGYALLAPARPSWRLPPMYDPVATGLRWYPPVLAAIIVIGWMQQALAALVNYSLAATVGLDSIEALLLCAVMGSGLAQAARLRRRSRRDPGQTDVAPAPLWFTWLIAACWLTVLTSFACLLLGYVALGNFLVKQLAWSAMLLGVAYLFTVLVADGCAAMLAAIKRKADDPNAVRASTRARCQVTVLLAGLARLAIILFTLMLLLAPFGEGPADWLQRIDHLRAAGVAIGQVQLQPLSILQAVLVLTLGIIVVSLAQRWLVTQYLPTTSLDAGMQVSAATLFGYAGYVAVGALALSAAGIGLERVAWIASALSVGIGFGLQAVVQNFVSGLILLAERPVKVGDWVSLGGVEGDIRRINVRATEIQMGDRSTVIVPNSEFITKVVRNVTHANPLGRVQFKLTMPVNTDAAAVRGLVLAAFDRHENVLGEPQPNVSLEGIGSDGLAFNATAYVKSPRAVSETRSALLFDVLQALRDAGLPLSTASAAPTSDAAPPLTAQAQPPPAVQ
jgi:small-conductance mechanosensitive channel